MDPGSLYQRREGMGRMGRRQKATGERELEEGRQWEGEDEVSYWSDIFAWKMFRLKCYEH